MKELNHVVLWNHKPEFSGEQKTENASRVKRELEALKGIIPGIIALEIVTNPLGASTADVALISRFESAESLQIYADHPEHKKAGAFVKEVFCNRTCVDFYSES